MWWGDSRCGFVVVRSDLWAGGATVLWFVVGRRPLWICGGVTVLWGDGVVDSWWGDDVVVCGGATAVVVSWL